MVESDFAEWRRPMRHALVALVMGVFAAASPAQELLERQRREEARQRYRAGEELMLAESFEEAEREFHAATRLDPSFVLAHYSLGQARMALKRYPGAVEAYTNCRDAILREATVEQRDRVDAEQRRREEVQDLEESLRRVSSGQVKGATPGQQVMLENRIRMLKDSQMRGLDRTARVPAEVPLALGSAYFRMGQLESAEQEYRSAIRTDGKLGAAHNNLAVICMMTGRLDEAKREVKAAEKAGFPVNSQFKKDLEQRASTEKANP